MNAISPNCLDDFLLSNPADRQLLELILSRKLPFPFSGKSGILLHGVWGTGKSTLAMLLPDLIEAAYEGRWDLAQGAGAMPAANSTRIIKDVFRCGGGLNSPHIVQKVNSMSMKMPMWHSSLHNYFVFDEVDRLTVGAQQSLRSTMDLPRCMFIFTTNYLGKIDQGIVNRCHRIEMNQATNASAYLPIGKSMLSKMGLPAGVVPASTLNNIALRARGSLRNFTNDVVVEGLANGGSI